MGKSPRRALVVGLGIAGMSAAVGLRDAGWEPVVIERSPARRTGGYFVGVFPDGKAAARELDVLDGLHTRNPVGGTDWQVNAHGRRKEAIGFLEQNGAPLAVMRGDIEEALWDRMQGVAAARHNQRPIEVRYGTRPTAIVNEPGLVRVMLEDVATGTTVEETFDLVVGSDGLRSTVRQLVFGEHEEFMKSWDAIICAFELDRQVPGFASEDSVTLALPKRATWIFAFSDRTPTALFTYRTKEIDAQFTQTPSESLEAVYGDLRSNPTVRHTLETMEAANTYLFDSVHSVHMPRWSAGRVVLLGDSAWCLTLYSGMGSTAGLRGGSELAKSLLAHPDDIVAALASWEASMRPFITAGQRRARILQHMFVPGGRVTSVIRDSALGALSRVARIKNRRSDARTAATRRETTRV